MSTVSQPTVIAQPAVDAITEKAKFSFVGFLRDVWESFERHSLYSVALRSGNSEMVGRVYNQD
jgi:hypothetical protein